MNEKQYEFLVRFKENMLLAEKAGYSRNIARNDRDKMKEILETLSREKFTKNIYCSSCLVEMLLKIKKYVDKYEEKLRKKSVELNNADDAGNEKECHTGSEKASESENPKEEDALSEKV